MAEYHVDVELYLPGGQLVKGRDAVGRLLGDIVKPFKDGGLCSVTFQAEQSRLIGNTLSVQWRASAPFLSKPYRGADAYITNDGLMAMQVTTSDRNQLVVMASH